ncbi:kinase-like domain-containing protein [Mycena pura]|uniref:Kinase-like domain-containing protein n=1 Tax=Mycena pura TaxID=153505 RepID=A0AAD6VHK7_9AGAR|nr:kinase-like domain-containing protein [Mycena pura]
MSNTGLAISLGKTPAQITAQFAPIPRLAPVAELICGIIQLCQNVTQNRCVRCGNSPRNAAVQLRDRCHHLGLALYGKAVAEEKEATAAIEAVILCLQQIYAKVNGWTQMNKVQGFLHQDEIVEDIECCHHMLTNSFQLISHTEILDWKGQFKLDTEEDHRELVAFMVNIENSQMITDGALQLMGNNLRRANRHHGLSSNLYDLQFKSRELLPDFHLRSGEVIRIGQFPIAGTSAMDIYEGLYLGREKVAIKVVRAINSDEHSLRRFERECDIWKKLWKIDQGEHILPFYGFCQEDGPFPYMVSPWQVRSANGTALAYVKKMGDNVDYLQLVNGIALGLQVLHSMAPHVVHGDLKASNVFIDKAGNPLISDFGLSRIVEDITGIPFTQSRGVSDAYRWYAPEVCVGQGVLSLSSDVYAYGMTVLEIFTHEQPYNNIKHTTEVVIRVSKGEHPQRPEDTKVIMRGLDDNMWALLGLCWVTEPSERPTIQRVLDQFPRRNSTFDSEDKGADTLNGNATTGNAKTGTYSPHNNRPECVFS